MIVAGAGARQLRKQNAVGVSGADAERISGRDAGVVVRLGVIPLQLISELDIVFAARVAAVVRQVVSVREPALRAEGVHGIGEQQAAVERACRSSRWSETAPAPG